MRFGQCPKEGKDATRLRDDYSISEVMEALHGFYVPGLERRYNAACALCR